LAFDWGALPGVGGGVTGAAFAGVGGAYNFDLNVRGQFRTYNI